MAPGLGGLTLTGSPAGKTATGFALAQLGEPYLWGGTGPGAWDCSGLPRQPRARRMLAGVDAVSGVTAAVVPRGAQRPGPVAPPIVMIRITIGGAGP